MLKSGTILLAIFFASYYLYAFIRYCQIMDAMMLSPVERKFLSDATRVVEAHLSEVDFNVTAFCCYLGKNRVTTYRRFRKILDKSAGDFIRDLRLTKASRMLEEGGCSIREAALMSGFHNHSYFSKCFRMKFGLSPSEFIKNLSSPPGTIPE